jgi:hypothetical protein
MAERTNNRQFPDSIHDETPSSIAMQVVVGAVFAAVLCVLLELAIKLTP